MFQLGPFIAVPADLIISRDIQSYHVRHHDVSSFSHVQFVIIASYIAIFSYRRLILAIDNDWVATS